MKHRNLLLSPSMALVALGALSTAPGCDCSGGGHTTVDSGPPTDSGPGPEGSTGGDGATAQDASDGGACNQHLPAGFSQVLASTTVPSPLTGNPGGRTLAMALDENDDPMFAYLDEPTTEAGVDDYAVMFTRWDPCAGAFTAPIEVDTNHGAGDVAVAYDPSTHEVGIAYEKDATDNDWADSYGTVWLASMQSPATSFSLQRLNQTHTCCHGNGALADWPTYVPAIAMHGGNIYIAYATSIGGGGGDEGLVWFLSSDSTYETPPTSADGGDGYEAGESDAGPPVHDFLYTPVPFDGVVPSNAATTGFLYPDGNSSTISVAVDSTGAPGLAAYEANGPGYMNYRTLFWRPGMTSAVVANEFNVDNGIDLALAFHGTSPVIAGHMLPSATSDSLTVVSSTDGMTWNTPVLLANGATGFTTALALDSTGQGVIASDSNGSNPTCAANPYIATSSDNGSTWTAACPATAMQGYTTHAVTAAYGSSRLTGTSVVGFVNSSGGSSAPTESGIVVWQSQ